MDLMHSQIEIGEEVFALWPGKMPLLNKKVRICDRGLFDGIRSFELISPLPVPLDEGIAQPDLFMQACDAEIFRSFLEKVKPDAIHIHTLMGIYSEFFDVAHELGIRTVFTTHDYFGICPKVTLYRNGCPCDDDHQCTDCQACNSRALSLTKIIGLQSQLYRVLKNTALVKKLRKQHRTVYSEEEAAQAHKTASYEDAEMYRKLRDFYKRMLEQMDCIHCNSSVARDIYSRYCNMERSRMLTISNREIVLHQARQKQTPGSQVQLVYLAPPKAFKGFFVLLRALDTLWNSGYNSFVLHVYFEVKEPRPYMQLHSDGFKRTELEQIFSQADALLAPSVWYETFGFTVLEALSFGVPVIVSDHVGAKDVIGKGGIIVQAGSEESLRKAVESLTKEKCAYLRQQIMESVHVKTWKEYLSENQTLYSAE